MNRTEELLLKEINRLENIIWATHDLDCRCHECIRIRKRKPLEYSMETEYTRYCSKCKDHFLSKCMCGDYCKDCYYGM